MELMFLLSLVAVIETFAAVFSGYDVFRLRKERKENPSSFWITLGAVLFGIAGCLGIFIGITI